MLKQDQRDTFSIDFTQAYAFLSTIRYGSASMTLHKEIIGHKAKTQTNGQKCQTKFTKIGIQPLIEQIPISTCTDICLHRPLNQITRRLICQFQCDGGCTLRRTHFECGILREGSRMHA